MSGQPVDRYTPDMAGDVDPAQAAGLTDLDPAAFREALHAVAEVMADYYASLESFSVFPPVEPGSLAAAFPAEPPLAPVPLAQILDDYERLVEPNATHWGHPGFMAYFATPGATAGILGEMLIASLGQNTMLWRTSPIGTELESVVVGWLRAGLGLPPEFDGFLNDTASTSSLIALAGARDAAGFPAAGDGLAGRPELGRPRVFASAEAHMSIEKACMTLGLGRTALVKIPTDPVYRMRPEALSAAIEASLRAGERPVAVVATLGTTSSTSIDPLPAIADIAAEHGIWLHVDAAYAGAVALLPERRQLLEGWERADSIVVNPHKWLFAPLDASLLLTRRMSVLRDAFSLVPDYLRTIDRAAPVRDINEYTPVLGRRFRALKLWVMLRWFGLEGYRRRIAWHLELAQALAGWVDADPDFERLAPVHFSVVCLRYRPRALAGREAEPDVATRLDELNAGLIDAVNRTGEVFLSHTRLDGRFTIRVALGHLRGEERHVQRAWTIIRRSAAALG
jgi:aromatic-L-amino-acid decarboxylase